MILGYYNIWRGAAPGDDYAGGEKTQREKLKLCRHCVKGDELILLLSTMCLKLCPDKYSADDFLKCPAYIIKDYLSLYLLSINPYRLFLDMDVFITDGEAFLKDIDHDCPAMECNENTGTFCNGIMYNSNDMKSFDDLLRSWLTQDIQPLQGAIHHMAKALHFKPLTRHFIHTMAGMNSNYRGQAWQK